MLAPFLRDLADVQILDTAARGPVALASILPQVARALGLRFGALGTRFRFEGVTEGLPAEVSWGSPPPDAAVWVQDFGHGDVGTVALFFPPAAAPPDSLHGEEARVGIRLIASAVRAARSRAAEDRVLYERQALLRSRDAFLDHLSHELRTPLNGVLGFSHLLAQTGLDPQQREMVESIEQCGQRLLGTFEGLLELSVLQAGPSALEPTLFSPAALLASVLPPWEEASREKGLGWEARALDSLPPHLYGDMARLGQAWAHLVGNAVKYTEAGSVRTALGAEARAGNEVFLVLDVWDTGPGFTAEPAGRVVRRNAGPGLGLALAGRIATLYGGDVELAPRAEGGTHVRMRVCLPLHLPSPQEPA